MSDSLLSGMRAQTRGTSRQPMLSTPSNRRDGRMDLILFAIGLLAVVSGIVMVGFGIPINAFEIGNTLILAGTVAAIGGLVMVGLAAVIRQLREFADRLDLYFARQSSGDAAVDPDSLARVPAPSRRGAASGQALTGTGELLSVAIKGSEQERAERRLAPGAAGNSTAFERRLVRGSGSRAADEDRSEVDETVSRHSGSPSEQPAVASSLGPVQERQRRVEPGAPRQAASRSLIARTSRQGPSAGGVSLDAADGRTDRALRRPGRVAAVKAAAESERASILKSGVIDGMAYTLYDDGSIEAELPEGTFKFDTIEHLRDYLATKE